MIITSLPIWVAGVTLLLSACAPAASPPVTPTASQAQPSAATDSRAGDAGRAQRFNGTVTALSAGQVTLDDGRSFSVTGSTSVTKARPGTASDVLAGEYIAVTAKRQSDDTLLATMVNVFAAAGRQFGQFQRAMADGNLMTNAIVEQVESVDGQRFTVTFPGGRDQVVLAPNAQIRVLVGGSPDDIKSGTVLSAQVVGDVAQTVFLQ